MPRFGKPTAQRPVVEALEPKLLYSADLGVAAFVPEASPTVLHQSLQASLQPGSQQAAPPAQSPHGDATQAVVTAQAASAATPDANTGSNASTAQHAASELVFIDASVPDADALVRDIQQQAAQGRAIEVIVIRPGEDGLSLITQTLQDRHDVSAIHLIAHGESGDMQLGSAQLDAGTLMQRAGEIAQWGTHLTAAADLLLYGCDVAVGTPGHELVQGLAALTGADVAASDDLTGARSLGGDWNLEVQTGHIDAALAVSASMQSRWDGVLTLAAPSTQGTAVWAKSGDAAAQQNPWDGLTLGAQTNTASLTSTFTVMTSAESPTRNEAIVVGVDASGAIRGERWDGTQWTALPMGDLAAGTVNNRQGFAVAYEQNSGDAVLTWNDGTHLRYSVFNGTSWSAAATVSAYTGAAPQQMRIASQPGSDQLALAISDANGDDYALIWDGSAWGHQVQLDTSGTTSADQLSTAVAFEAKTGRAMVAYAKAGNANVYYRLYSGGTWGSETAVGSFSESAVPYTLTLASDPTSNRIALGFLSKGSGTANQVSLDVWSGSAWGTRLVADNYNDATPGSTVALAFESTSGDLLAVYGGDASTVRYRTLASGTSTWSAQSNGPATGIPGATQLFADPYTDHIVLGVQSESGTITYTDWNGSGFGNVNTVVSDSGSTQTDAFTWLWRTNLNPNKANTLLVGPNNAATGWNGVNSVSGTEVLEMTDPGLSYGATTTDGSFRHLGDFAAAGATGIDDIVYVSRNVTLQGSVGVQKGDLLFTTSTSNTVLTSADGSTITVNNDDVVRFRPTVAGHYDKGTFTILVQALGSSTLGVSGGDVKGLALVEQATTVAGTSEAAGMILFTQGTGTAAANIKAWNPANASLLNALLLGSGATTFITGSNVGINQAIDGLEVVSQSTPMKNVTLNAGQLLFTLDQTDTAVGSNNVAVNQGDVAILTATSTTAATASILVHGSTVGINGCALDSLALSLDAAPTITSNSGGATASISYAENGTAAVTTVVGADTDTGSQLTYKITGGADAGRFSIDASTGVLTFIESPDYENPLDANADNGYVVTVGASDGTYTATQTITVNVTNVNEAPVITSNGGGSSVIVLVPSGTRTATTVQAADPDAGDTITYSISGWTASSFSINASTGVLTFKTPTAYNNTSGNGYMVNVTATDAAGLSSTQQLIFSVQQGNSVQNTAPVISSDGGGSSASLTVVEQQTYVTRVQAASTGYYENDTITYAISGGADQSLFKIDSKTGELRFKTAPLAASPTDSGANNVYNVTVSASDGTYTDTQALAITVQAYDKPPVNTLPSNFVANEDTWTALTGLSVTDADAGTSNITVTLGVSNGTLSVLNNVSGGVTQVAYANGNRQVTLTGTQAAIRATLAASNGVLYRGDSNYHGSDTLTMVSDDLGNSGAAHAPAATTDTDTAFISVASMPDPPVLTASTGNLSYTENDAPTPVDPAIALNDVDGGTYTSATVKITGNYASGEDVLSFTNQLGIVGSWDAASGTLTLSGSAPISSYQAALRAVTYYNTSDAPSNAVRQITFSISDTTAAGTATATRNIAVIPVNDVPVLAGSGTTLSYTEKDGPVAIDPAVSISDVDSNAYSGATVRITGHYVSGQDVLAFTPANGITGSWNATTGTLTLSGSSSLANYQAALQSVTYENTSDNPDTTTRTITFAIDEGNGPGSVTRDIALTAVNDPPTLITTPVPRHFTAGDPATPVDPGITLRDPDNATLSGATVQITGNYMAGEDQLSITPPTGISQSWDATTGTLTLTGTASFATYQTALQAVSYLDSAATPDTHTRVVAFTVDDGSGSGPVTATRSINVQLVNNPPVLTTSNGAITYNENDPPTAIDNAIALSDVDTSSFTWAQVQITGHYTAGQDVLALDPAAGVSGISASWDATAGTLTLTGSASTADFQTALQHVTYANSSDAPDATTRTATFRINDGNNTVAATRDIAVNPSNDAPTVQASNGTVNFVEGASPLAIDTGLVVGDVDNATLAGASVQISGHYVSTEDELVFNDQLGITHAWDSATGTLTLTGSATLADYQTALRSVAYHNTSHDPDTQDRTITFSVSDGSLSGSATRGVSVTSVNDPPAVTPSGTPLAYREGDGAVSIDGALTVTDNDDPQLVGASVQITGHYVPGQDVLAFGGHAGISGSWDATTGTLTLTGSATPADYQTALQLVTYENTSVAPDAATRTLTISVSDDESTTVVTRDIGVTPVDNPPALGTTPGSTSYTENDAPTIIDGGVTLSDVDTGTFTQATVQITGHHAPGEDVLSYTGPGSLGLTASWDDSSGTLTLSGNADAASYQAALRQVAYANLSNAPSTLTRTITFTISDGTTPVSATRDVSVTAVSDPPSLTTTGTTLTYTENAGDVAIDPGLALTDVDTTTFYGASVQITDNYVAGQDELHFTSQLGITGQWDAASGTLTLSGSASLTDYQTALRSVAYSNASDNPDVRLRSVTFSIGDDSTVASGSRDIAITPVDDAPTIQATGTQLSYTENDPDTAIDAGLTINDVDSTAITGATVSLGSYVQGQDVVSFTDQAGITHSWDATQGILTLSGSASIADYQTALRSVTYRNTSDNPDTTPRTVSFTVSDGTLSGSATRTIGITAVNDSPVLSISLSTLNYTENDPATPIAPSLSISDVDSLLFSSASVRISSGYAAGQDVLSAVTSSGVNSVWDAGTGTLTLSGSATLLQYQSILRSVAYSNTSDNPDTTPRTVTFSLVDGLSLVSIDSNVSITAVNDAPVLSTTGPALAYTENQSATPIAPALSLSDVDSPTLDGATVVIASNYAAGQDLLSFTDQSGITGTWDASSGTLTLSGSATVAQYQSALRSIGYSNTSDDPDTRTRTVRFTVDDAGLTATATHDVALTAVNDAPVLSISGPALAYTENDAATPIAPGLSLSDVDSPTLAGATVRLSANGLADQDVLGFTDQQGITGTWDAGTGTLTLSGQATVSQYEAALRTVSYRNTSDAPDTTPRQVSFSVSDGAASASATQTITLTATDDAPVVQTTGGALPYTENDPDTAIDPGLTIADVDNTDMAGATIRISGHYVAGEDLLSFTDQAGITGSWDGASGTLTLSGTASIADYQAALRSIGYRNTSDNPDTATRTVSFAIDDGTLGSNAATRDIAITAVNDAPVLAITDPALSYTEKDPATAVAPGLSLSDVDTGVFSGATVRISGNYAAGEDVLSFTDPSGTSVITGTWDATTGTLTLSGNASTAQYQSALQSVAYRNTSENPGLTTRTVLFSVSDGSAEATATRDIAITPVDDAPTLSLNGAAPDFVEKSAAIAIAPALTIGDVDTPTFNGATVQISGAYAASEDTLVFNDQAGITGAWHADTGTLSLSGNATMAQYQAALRSIGYRNSSDAPSTAARTITFSIGDAHSTATASATLAITPVNDAPVITANSLSVVQGNSAQPLIAVTDVDTPPDQLTITVSGVTGGRFVNTSNATTVTQFRYSDALAGRINFVSDGGSAAPTYALSVSDGALATPVQAGDVRFATVPVVSASVATASTPSGNADKSRDDHPDVKPADAPPPKPAPSPTAETAPMVLAGSASNTQQHNGDRYAIAPPPAEMLRPPSADFESRDPTAAGKAIIEIVNKEAPKVEAAAMTMPEGFQFRWGGDLQSAINADDLRRNLDSLRGQMQQEDVQHRQVVASSIALTTGLSMGYVVWLVRGGALLGSMLSAMPAWQMIDPLPVLTRSRTGGRGDADGSDDQPVEHLFDGDGDHGLDDRAPAPHADGGTGPSPAEETRP